MVSSGIGLLREVTILESISRGRPDLVSFEQNPRKNNQILLRRHNITIPFPIRDPKTRMVIS